MAMSTIYIIRGKRTSCNRRESAGRKAKAALSLLATVFIVSTAIVYTFSPNVPQRRQPFSATATVIMPESLPADTSPDDAILSDANLARAVGLISASDKGFSATERSASLGGRSLEDIRRDLSVKTADIAVLKAAEDSAANKAEISITYSGQGSEVEACRLVDLLAEQTARQDADRRRTTAELAHQKAKAKADSARKGLFQAQAEYDAFLNLYLTSKRSTIPPSDRAEMDEDGRTAPGPLPPGVNLDKPTAGIHFDRPDWAEGTKSPTAKNPRWTELNKKLALLTARRATMLERMTAVHPEVQNIELEIADLERQITSTPREMPRAGRDSLPPITPLPPDPTDDLLAPGGEGRRAKMLADAPTAPTQLQPELIPPQGDKSPDEQPPVDTAALGLRSRLEEEFRLKQKALDAAREKYNRLAAAERDAWQAMEKIPTAEVVPSICPKTPPGGLSGRRPWAIVAASFVGLICVGGVGMFSLGISPPASFANAAEVRAVLKTPVVGTIPAVDLPGDAEYARRRPINWMALTACAILFLAAIIITAAMIF